MKGNDETREGRQYIKKKSYKIIEISKYIRLF